ncbi:malonate decarboxylase holo-ACP synthase [Nocardia sp. NPDC127526]|uniref:malonate decarboxylase holo-ACP synthase n=1 Tax=Nocardia sp. NPDC127526 TaxID=3345393 RepID=UPI00363B7EDD
MTIDPRPHDLVRLNLPEVLRSVEAPSWVADSLKRAPWAVVHRREAKAGRCPVVIRGNARWQRFALDIGTADYTTVVSPEELADRGDELPDLPAVRTLRAVRRILDETGWCWGPTGGIGYQIVTGEPTVTADSDLDLAIRFDRLPPRDELRMLGAELRRLHGNPVRIDCLIELPIGAIALGELSVRHEHNLGARILLRTASGPCLVRLGG